MEKDINQSSDGVVTYLVRFITLWYNIRVDKKRLYQLTKKLAETHLKVLQLEALYEDCGEGMDSFFSTLQELDIDEYCLMNEIVETFYDLPEQS